MKILISLFLFCLSLQTYAQSNVYPATDIINKLYANSKYLGFAVGNHSSIQVFRDMERFLLETAANDPEFKYIYIESPAELQEILFNASINLFPWNELGGHLDPYWYERIMLSPQLPYLFVRILKTVQEINRSRSSENPILIIPIDSISKKWNQHDEALFTKGGPFLLYAGSVTREQKTAETFLDHTAFDPNAKAAIFYHQAHILKSLTADGLNFDNPEQPISVNSQPLGWIGFASQQKPELTHEFKVILFNEGDSSFNPGKIINLNAFQSQDYGIGMGGFMDGSEILSKDLFLKESYLMKYRSGTIQFPEKANSIFDAFINY